MKDGLGRAFIITRCLAAVAYLFVMVIYLSSKKNFWLSPLKRNGYKSDGQEVDLLPLDFLPRLR